MKRWPGVDESPTETAIIQLLEAAGWGTAFRPMVYVTSARRSLQESGFHDYHVDGLAVDFGANSQYPKDELAGWLYQFTGYELELIHTTGNGSSGWYVKNGNKQSKGYYGTATEDAHVDHVHLAMNFTGVDRLSNDSIYKSEVKVYNAWVVANTTIREPDVL